jgi:hypothetical protein
VKKLFTLLSLFTLITGIINSQEAFKVNVHQPAPFTIQLTREVDAMSGAIVDLDGLFEVEGNTDYYRVWTFWDGMSSQAIDDPLYTVTGDGFFCIYVVNENQCSVLDTVILNLITGIDGIYEKNRSQYIDIYPNPNSGTFNLKINNCEPGYSIEVINTLGVHLLSKSLDCKTDQLMGPVSFTLSKPGIYYLIIRDQGKIVISKKVIILNR